MMISESANTSGTVELPCGHCGEAASFACGQCKNMRYCSLECQQADWRMHKILCKAYPTWKNFRFDPSRRKAIIMMKGDPEPKFLAIPCEAGEKLNVTSGDVDEDEDEDVVSAETLEACRLAEGLGVPVADETTETFLPKQDSLCGRARGAGGSMMLVCGSKGGGQLLPYSIHVVSSRSITSETEPNACLSRLVGPAAAARWTGTVIIYAMSKVFDSSVVVDIDTRGFTLALDAMAAETSPGPTPPKKTKGVLVSATEPHFQQSDVPTAHPVFTKGTLSQVTQLIGGSTTRSYKQPSLTPAAASASPSHSDEPVNPASWLQLAVNPDSRDFGKIPAAISRDPTTMLVVRADRLAMAQQPCYLTTATLQHALNLIQKEALPILRDDSKTPRERCRLVKEKSDRRITDLTLQFINSFAGLPQTMPTAIGDQGNPEQ